MTADNAHQILTVSRHLFFAPHFGDHADALCKTSSKGDIVQNALYFVSTDGGRGTPLSCHPRRKAIR
jgi:hypothetical protein